VARTTDPKIALAATDRSEIALNAAELNPAKRLNGQALYLAELSPGSRRAAAWRLETAAALLGVVGVFDWSALTYPQAIEIRGRAAERYAPKTAASILASVRGACRTAWRVGLMDSESFQRVLSVPAIKGSSPPVGRYVSRSEIRDLLAVCGDGPAGARDLAMLAVLFGAGLRRGELADLSLEDLRGGFVVVERGKGRKGRRVPLAPSTLALVEPWTEIRGGEPGPLFCPVGRGGSVRISKLSGEGIRKRLNTLARRAGVDALRPHDARRTYASVLLDAGADLAVVARLLGHSSIQVTAGYDRRGEIAEVEAANLVRLPVEPKRDTGGTGE
jgi:integrase